MKKFVPPSVTFVSLCVFPLNLPFRLSLFALLLLLVSLACLLVYLSNSRNPFLEPLYLITLHVR